jgi:hypothetical protein
LYFFAIGWLKPSMAAITLLVASIIVISLAVEIFADIKEWLSVKNERRLKPLFIYIGVLLIWLAFSGVGGLGFQNADYAAHNALLLDLIQNEWPLKFETAKSVYPLIYYIGYYLPAGAVGKWFGWLAANIFLFFWSALGIFLSFAWFLRVGNITSKGNIKKAALVVLFFCLAGGLDVLGYYFSSKHPTLSLTRHLDGWADFFQYSSNSTLLFWVPQHVIAAWVLVGTLASTIIEQNDPKYLGITLASGILWSPFGVLGLVPYLLVFFIQSLVSSVGRKRFFNKETITFNIMSLWIGVIYLLFLLANKFHFPMGLIWNMVKKKFRADMPFYIMRFEFFEFGLLSGLVILLVLLTFFSRALANKSEPYSSLWHKFRDDFSKNINIPPAFLALFVLALVILSILPIYKVGSFNDFCMRASIASLFILWAFVGNIIFEFKTLVRGKLIVLYWLIVFTFVVGTFSSFVEISRSFHSYTFGPPASSSIKSTSDYAKMSSTSESARITIMQRMGNNKAIFYTYFGKKK